MDVPSFSSIEFSSVRSLQEQLLQQLTHWICSGHLPPGTRLPASRRLSVELGISRNTVVTVLDQLRAEGFLKSYQGRGVFVSPDLPQCAVSLSKFSSNKKYTLPKLSDFGQGLNETSLTDNDGILPFTPGIPDISIFPIKLWSRIQRRHQDRVSLMGHNESQGYAPLREALSQYLKLSRGMCCTPHQIVITQGVQQSISLCSQILLNEGDSVLVENSGYLGVRKAFQARRAKLVSCPMSDNGIDLNALLTNDRINSFNSKLMYITSTRQYPLGRVLPAAQRLKLLDWASQQNIWLLEDDYDSELHYFNKPIGALQGMVRQAPVIYMGNFSKTLFPALNLGYIVVPAELVKVFIKAKEILGSESPMLSQAVVADFIHEGHFVRHLRKMRMLYEKKGLHLNKLIKEEISEFSSSISQSAGMHLTIEISNIDDLKLKQGFEEFGFGSSALSSYFLEDTAMKGLVLGFANTTEKQRLEGIDLLKGLIPQFQKTAI